MTPKLTQELSEALAEQPGQPLTVEDPVTHTQYVLVPLDVYGQLQRAVGEDAAEPDPRAFYSAFARAVRDDLDAPGMEGYDEAPSRGQPWVSGVETLSSCRRPSRREQVPRRARCS